MNGMFGRQNLKELESRIPSRNRNAVDAAQAILKISQEKALFERIDGGEKLAINDQVAYMLSGVIVSFRKMGKLAFCVLVSNGVRLQIVIRANEFGEEYKDLISSLSLNTHLRVYGVPAVTSTREISLVCHAAAIVQEARSSFPDKWNGISQEEKRRLRYQDTLVQQDKALVFYKRNDLLSGIRDFMLSFEFLEVETPILHNVSAGAQARPFTTECNALDKQMYLRIAPETYLKRMTAGGFHRVFEIGKQFRNEGIDSSHMPEFTSCEWYEAYTDFSHQQERFISLLESLDKRGFSLPIDIKDIKILDYKKLIANEMGIDVETYDGDLDELFKKNIRPKLIDPCFVTGYPSKMAPLAKAVEHAPEIAEMWQFIWNGQEVAKCYTELTDPVEQRKRLELQMAARENGDTEAMMLDEAFLQTMEFGMPPQAGLGFGVDRLLALYLNIDDIRDTVFFPPGY